MEARVRELIRKYGVRVLIVIGAVALLALLLWWLWSFIQPEGFKQRIAFIQLASTVAGGATLVGGLLLNFWGQWVNQKTQDENQKLQIENQQISLQQLDNAREQLKLTRKGQVTESFTKAIEQLGDEKREIRLGGIAALKQLADQDEFSDQEIADQDESSNRRWQIMEILTAYVRERAQYESSRRTNRGDHDIQAALNVIGDLTERYGTHRGERYLSLASTDLMALQLSGLHLQGTNLRNAHLEGTGLVEAHLEGTDLTGAHLEGAYLLGAHLEGAILHGANLQGAHVTGAKLAGAKLGAANLLGASFQLAEFEAELPTPGEEVPEWWSMLPSYMQGELTAKSENGLVKAELTRERSKQINGDWSTKLPSDWPNPVWWSTLSSRLPTFRGLLSPGEYHIKLGNIPMSFSVDEGWYSDLTKLMPVSFSLTLTGEATAGSILTFYRGHSVIDLDKFRSVIDPDKPKEYATAVLAERNLSRWFLEHCRAYLEVGKLEDVDPPIGGARGTQFEASVFPNKGIRTILGLYAPAIPIFPTGIPREDPFFLVEGDKGLIIILSVAGEPMTIIVTSPESEFEEFRERAGNVLDTVEWLSLERLEEA